MLRFCVSDFIGLKMWGFYLSENCWSEITYLMNEKSDEWKMKSSLK